MRRPAAAHSVAWKHHKREIQQLKHEAACCSTFSCLEASQTRDSGGFQVNLAKPNLFVNECISLIQCILVMHL
ncbi:hypothetical protein CSKR_111008 [Clonorchis sinensis]|uniref:Uncharacterized protein n=1 Tax=Clonorchis sinensis TaxID=79923 RepID=A0A3R7EPZ9_CLOSI|nr:hypothetical protein CSKR_111008 [Clonorchis sinensis]